jgi:hypothetical protein
MIDIIYTTIACFVVISIVALFSRQHFIFNFFDIEHEMIHFLNMVSNVDIQHSSTRSILLQQRPSYDSLTTPCLLISNLIHSTLSRLFFPLAFFSQPIMRLSTYYYKVEPHQI